MPKQAKNSYVPRTSTLVIIGKITVLAAICVAMGFLFGLDIGYEHGLEEEPNDLRNQIIELRTEQTVIRGQFNSISTLYHDLRIRTEVIEEKNETIRQAIQSIRGAGQASTPCEK